MNAVGKTFTKGERVNVHVRSGSWSSNAYAGTVDSMTPSGLKVRVVLQGRTELKNYSVRDVRPMTDHEIAVESWIDEQPTAETMFVNPEVDRNGPGRCDLRQNRIVLDAEHLTAVRDDLDALIAWVAKRPVRK